MSEFVFLDLVKCSSCGWHNQLGQACEICGGPERDQFTALQEASNRELSKGTHNLTKSIMLNAQKLKKVLRMYPEKGLTKWDMKLLGLHSGGLLVLQKHGKVRHEKDRVTGITRWYAKRSW